MDINSDNHYVKYFGDPSEGNLAFDNVVPWKVEGLTTLTDVVSDIIDLFGASKPVLVTYNVPDWTLPIWRAMCENCPTLERVGAGLLDLKDVYYSIEIDDLKFDYPQDEAYKLFARSRLPKKFGLVSLADKYRLRLTDRGMPTDQPSAKAALTKKVMEILFSKDYPQEESEA